MSEPAPDNANGGCEFCGEPHARGAECEHYAGRNPPVPRECGPCTLCCTVFRVEELGKPVHVPCSHVCASGCAIYAQRPLSCRDFTCGWLRGVMRPEDRPDRVGVVFVPAPLAPEDKRAGFMAFERTTGDASKGRVAKFIASAKSRGFLVAIVSPDDARKSRAKWSR